MDAAMGDRDCRGLRAARTQPYSPRSSQRLHRGKPRRARVMTVQQGRVRQPEPEPSRGLSRRSSGAGAGSDRREAPARPLRLPGWRKPGGAGTADSATERGDGRASTCSRALGGDCNSEAIDPRVWSEER